MEEKKLLVIGTTNKSRTELKRRARRRGKSMKDFINSALYEFDKFTLR